MTKIELAVLLKNGHTLSSILNFASGQECDIYKAGMFEPGDRILYIPDLYLNEIPVDKDISSDDEAILDVLGECFTGDDFIKECDGDLKLAERLFWYCDWQHPSAARYEIGDENESE